jgi:hypothetical protein
MAGLFLLRRRSMKRKTVLRLVDTRMLDRQQWPDARTGGFGNSGAVAAVGGKFEGNPC